MGKAPWEIMSVCEGKSGLVNLHFFSLFVLVLFLFLFWSFVINTSFYLLTMSQNNWIWLNAQYLHLVNSMWVMVYDLYNNDTHIWIVHVLCVIAPCCRSVHLSDCDLQRFLCRWFAWSSTLLLSLSFTQRAVVKSVPTSPLHDWTSSAVLTNQTRQQKSCNTIAQIIDCQLILFSPFVAPPICSWLNATTCRCDWLCVIDWVGGRVLIHYKLMLLYAYYAAAGHTQANMHSQYNVINHYDEPNTSDYNLKLHDRWFNICLHIGIIFTHVWCCEEVTQQLASLSGRQVDSLIMFY